MGFFKDVYENINKGLDKSDAFINETRDKLDKNYDKDKHANSKEYQKNWDKKYGEKK